MALTSIESLFEPVNQFGMVRKGAMESMGEMPPVKLVSSSPAEGLGQAVVPGQGLYPVSSITDQKKVLCPAESQVGFTFQK